jgi:hypothetical protein
MTATHRALENVTEQQVVVHRLGRDLSDRLGRHLNVSKMLGSAGLPAKSRRNESVITGSTDPARFAFAKLTFLFLARRNLVTSPNWEKYAFISSS